MTQPQLSPTPATVPLVVIVGPTASGKSQLAVDVALELISRGRPAEVVNADSMAVYVGMDIGTAKPTPQQRAAVRHHLVDVWSPEVTASVAEFQALARQVIASLRDEGVVPVLVGGSALYTHAVTDVIDFPGTDPQVRARWQHRLDEVGPEALHGELAALAPDAARQILPQNGRRIVRALEVITLTGSFTATLPEPAYALDDVHQFGLEVDRAEMDARIATRVDQMWRDGLVDEVRRLEARGLRAGRTASRALGYRQVLDHLAGECTEDEARLATIAQTKRFARKQLGWFRRDRRITWLPAGDPTAVERVVTAVLGVGELTDRHGDPAHP
ncbi:tRNA (adenosine(37)-N6)-dimethylallyltransferase MiaA [Aestuariimicrobium soli]|uniref:tRNA (adenosine(37)-N6)-dimethylallyltransferase MiaA n=1 Tax=Aestuariimicrobium soli TaxID=2035834 RepID=UPI003EB83C19